MLKELTRLSKDLKSKNKKIPNEEVEQFLRDVIPSFETQSINLEGQIYATMEVIKLAEQPREFEQIRFMLHKARMVAFKEGNTKNKGEYVKFSMANATKIK